MITYISEHETTEEQNSKIIKRTHLKHLCQCLFLNKVAGACNFIKKEALAQVFSCEFCKISKNTFSYRTPPVAASVVLKVQIRAMLGKNMLCIKNEQFRTVKNRKPEKLFQGI